MNTLYLIHEIAEAKAEIERLKVLHKYLGKAWTDIQTYGWSSWQHLFIKEHDETLLWAAERSFKEVAQSWDYWEKELERCEIAYGQAIAREHELKTKAVQDARRFEYVWNRDIHIESYGEQFKLF